MTKWTVCNLRAGRHEKPLLPPDLERAKEKQLLEPEVAARWRRPPDRGRGLQRKDVFHPGCPGGRELRK